MIITRELKISSKGELDIINLTDRIDDIVKEANVRNGLCLIFSRSSTSAITAIEFEPGLIEDFKRYLERTIPKNIEYEHEKKWHDGNGHSHVRASSLKPDLCVPIVNGSLALGTWQQIVFMEFDIRPRERSIIVQIIT
ncbi:MAG: secondary thiamine-phosphate synthase enzyme YjbQ [Thermoplasmata archaeon]|mgnify:CR=1 FL=1|jgi:secondary thiamine-phosphate synthase enzyme|nr:YjbQ family protein [Thermoplasmatales archaeon]PMP75637.1 MAG: secondary thiamine-phosphate synthase enzyme [Aciduliprofundum sp.]HEU12523.1 YjbQ family protein [Euryarchaeota archaeon]